MIKKVCLLKNPYSTWEIILLIHNFLAQTILKGKSSCSHIMNKLLSKAVETSGQCVHQFSFSSTWLHLPNE